MKRVMDEDVSMETRHSQLSWSDLCTAYKMAYGADNVRGRCWYTKIILG